MILFIGGDCVGQVTNSNNGWPIPSIENKPWTRWWWHGSAVTKEGITQELDALASAHIGGVEITPIYGVYGYEKQFVEYLSPEWMELLLHTLCEAKRLSLGVDMATGTGWPFGGPWIGSEDACKNVYFKIFDLSEGEELDENVTFIQAPYLRAVGSQIYEVHDNAEAEGRIVQGTRKEPLMKKEIEKSLTIESITEPVAANKNLQALALDQVQFEKSLPLQALIGYSDAGEVLDLTSKVNTNGMLQWKAGKGKWKLYAVFQGFHGKMVERAAPGGEGNVIDHFSEIALERYLQKFDSAFGSHDIRSLRAFFNDSYEVDDARGVASWTPMLFEEFQKRRGYDLRHYLPSLFGHDTAVMNDRVLCDYRETISELLLSNFTTKWKEWAHKYSAIVRNQAHGSPANILDLYSTVDIPEIEGVEPLRIKMASSAGNVSGKQLVSAEAATWLDEHFQSSLWEVKDAVDLFFLNGVNHIVYHGTAYSPKDDPWPGWLFYAAVHFNPRNPFWDHFKALNEYVARCQSLLQRSAPDNDVLLYYPVYDRFSFRSPELIEHFDGIGRQFEGSSFERTANSLLSQGFSFDYVSDKQILDITIRDGKLLTSGGSAYSTIVVPRVKYIPLATFRKLDSLISAGANVIFAEGLPESFSGFSNERENKVNFTRLVEKLKNMVGPEAEKNADNFSINLASRLTNAGIARESMVDQQLKFVRRKTPNGLLYLVKNPTKELFEGWVNIRGGGTVNIFDPMTGRNGRGVFKAGRVYLQLSGGASLIIQTGGAASGEFNFFNTGDQPITLRQPWMLRFVEGGPTLPKEMALDSLRSWTELGVNLKNFSGTAAYKTGFAKPSGNVQYWKLDFGEVHESAEVYVNDIHIGTLIGPDYWVILDAAKLKPKNMLEVRVSNSMANRIIYMEQKQALWKKFYNVNFPARKEENRKNGLFNASLWAPFPSGLIGPVRLFSLEIHIPGE